MSIFGRKTKGQSAVERLDATEVTLREVQAEADKRQPRVTSLYLWAISRRVQNGINEDFEWTLDHPRGAVRG